MKRNNLQFEFFNKDPTAEVEWYIHKDLADYEESVKLMEKRAIAIANDIKREAVWLLEYPPLYTAGTSANPKDLIDRGKLPIYHTGRGGQYTYHGPGQRVIYILLNLKQRYSDLRRFIAVLEQWIINSLLHFNIIGKRHEERIGVWITSHDQKEEKIAAIGIRVKKWVSFHGIAINIKPDLQYYNGIIPCGIREYGVTSIEKLGYNLTIEEFDKVMQQEFISLFGPLSLKQQPFF